MCVGLSVWQQMPHKEAHLVLLRRLIQRAGLRAYLLYVATRREEDVADVDDCVCL